jgi:sugar lactone lactonase YvrE
LAFATTATVFGGTALADQSSVALPEGSPFPENVTSTADGTLYVSSISHGGITRAKPGAATAEVWIEPGAFETRSTFGLLADERSGMLWVCSNDASAIGQKGPTQVEGGWVKGFDLATGQGKISAKLPGAPALCNDFAIGADGSVYATNTMGAQILRLKPGATELESWLVDDALKGGVDGIAFGEDGNLYVNTFLSGELFQIGVKDGAPGKVTKLKTSRPLKNPDGIRPVEGGFLMVEGDGPLDFVTVSGDVATIETLDRFKGPTGVTIAGDTVWIAEGQLDHIFDPAKKDLPLPTFQIRATPLVKR